MVESSGKLISELKVHELRAELINRGLDGNGVKAALVGRLEKALQEQGVDINSFLFATTTSANDTTPAMETENNDGNAAAAAQAVAASKDETGKNKEEQQKEGEAVVPENVKAIKPDTTDTKINEETSNSLTADDLVEKVEDEIDEAELRGETEDATTKTEISNGNSNEKSPDIADLEEREESEGDEAKNDSIPMETEDEIKEDEEQQQTSAIHEISDEEDLEEDMLTNEETTDAKMEKKVDDKPVINVPTESVAKKESEPIVKKDAAKPKIPAGLNFPPDDPHGLRCIWIRSIPTETRLSELKLAFNDGGFTVETAKIFTTKQSSRPSAFGFMTLSTQEGAKNAVAKMNNSIFKGKVITVERACDASMLQSDLLPPNDRPKVHPPIKPPEDFKPTTDASRSRIISTSKSSRTNDSHTRHDRSRIERSPYMNTVNRVRVLRTDPHRIVESSGRSIRVTSRDSGPLQYSRTNSRRSPVRSLHRERTPPPRHHHRSPERDRIADERRKYEEMLRKREEEFRRKEESLRNEAERNRIKLEKERLEKENLALKLRLQQEQQLRAAAPSNVRRSSPPHLGHSSSRHRGNTPPPRRQPSPPRSSRRASPPRVQLRRSQERHEPRPYRADPPKEAFPPRRRSRSRSPVRSFDRPHGTRDRPEEYSRGRPVEHGSSRRPPRPESPIRSVAPPKYDRHSPRRNYESSSRNDRPKTEVAYEDPQRTSRSSRNGGSGRDFPASNTYDRPSSGNAASFASTHRDFSAPSNNPASYNFSGSTTDYRNPVNSTSYSTTSSNSRNQLPPSSTNSWPQPNYVTTNLQPQQQPWGHQPQANNIPPTWNPTFTGMRNNGSNSNQRYGGGF